MDRLIEEFPEQLEKALQVWQNADLRKSEKEIQNVLITGLGGSGIGGTVVSEVVTAEARVPILLNKDYEIPAFVDQHTLVIVSSYSGNTEETIAALEEAIVQNAEIACITSNGSIAEKAREKGLNLIEIPAGYPPRAAFAYSLVQQFILLHHYGVIPDYYEHELRTAIELLRLEKDGLKDVGQRIAKHFYGKVPIVYAANEYKGIAIRIRQQLNENAKVLGWHHVVPEMNHNELVGWANGSDQHAVLFLRDPDERKRIAQRMDISKEIIEKQTNNIMEVHAKGESRLEKSIYLIVAGDWASYYLALQNGVDPVEVNVIEHLKGELKKLS